MSRRGPDLEPLLVNGLLRLDLQAKSLNDMDRGGFRIRYYGNIERSVKDEKSLSGFVAVYQDGILARSYGEPRQIWLEMIDEENARVQRIDPSLKIIPPPNVATAINVAKEAEKQFGFNVLPWYTGVADGSLIAGNFHPRHGANVSGSWNPLDRLSGIGVLPLAVRA